jgi:hypothetical protein
MRDVAYWLAVFRATRLLQIDQVPPLPQVRARIMDRYGATPWSQLLDCPWCLSVWVAGLLWVLRLACPRLADAVIGILAASAVTGLVSQAVDELGE